MPALARAQRHPVDHGAFSVPSAQSWYWIGMLGADGCVSDDGMIYLRLQERDEEHVKALRSFVGAGNEGRISGPSKADRSYCLAFTSRPMAADLLRLGGIAPRKSLTYDPGPEAAAQAAFWLGMLDGDGTAGIYVMKQGNATRPQLRWLGTKAAMARCANFWTEALPDAHIGALVRCRRLWEVHMQGETAQRAAVILLASAPFSLARKRPLLERIAAFQNAAMRNRGRSCASTGCDLPHYANGYCTRHYPANRPRCLIDGCDRPQSSRGWCGMHTRRARANEGDPGPVGLLRPPREGCVIAGCDRPHAARGWCEMHYKRVLAGGDPGPAVAIADLPPSGCSVEGCDRPHGALGWCRLHYIRSRSSNGDPGPVDPLVRVVPESCTVAGCDRKHLARGMCARHYDLDRDRRQRAIAAGGAPDKDRRRGRRLPAARQEQPA